MEDSGRRSQARRQAGKIQWRESVDRLSIYVGWMDCTASRIHGLTHSRVSGQSRAEINKITIQHATASGRGRRQKVSMQPCTKAILLHPTENLCFLALLYFGLIDSLVQGTLLGCMVEVSRLSKSLDLHESTHGRMPIPPSPSHSAWRCLLDLESESIQRPRSPMSHSLSGDQYTLKILQI